MLGSAPKRPMRLLGGSCRIFKNEAESRMIYGFMLDREGKKKQGRATQVAIILNVGHGKQMLSTSLLITKTIPI